MEAIVTAATFAVYALSRESELLVNGFGIMGPILILNCIKDIDYRVKLFILIVLAWNVIDLLTKKIASLDDIKNELKPQGCTYTVSISKDDPIEEKMYRPNSPAPDSTMSNSSQRPMDESTLPTDSTSPPQNMDAPVAM
jgi:hypothetical protein